MDGCDGWMRGMDGMDKCDATETKMNVELVLYCVVSKYVQARSQASAAPGRHTCYYASHVEGILYRNKHSWKALMDVPICSSGKTKWLRFLANPHSFQPCTTRIA